MNALTKIKYKTLKLKYINPKDILGPVHLQKIRVTTVFRR